MSAADKNIDFVAATVSEIRKSLKAANDAANFRLAELAQNLEDSGAAAAIDKLTEAIAAQTKAIEALSSPGVNFTAPATTVNVPQQAAPVINIEPTPITVECTMPQGPAPTAVFNAPRIASWEMRMKGSYGGPDRVIQMIPTYRD